MSAVASLSAGAWAAISTAVGVVSTGYEVYSSSRASHRRSKALEEQRAAAKRQKAQAARENAHKRRQAIAQRKKEVAAITNNAALSGALGSSGSIGAQNAVIGQSGSNLGEFIGAQESREAVLSHQGRASAFSASADRSQSMAGIAGGIGGLAFQTAASFAGKFGKNSVTSDMPQNRASQGQPSFRSGQSFSFGPYDRDISITEL